MAVAGIYSQAPSRKTGGISVVSTRFSLYESVSRLTWDGTAEPISRDMKNIIYPVQLTTSKIDNVTWLIHTLL